MRPDAGWAREHTERATATATLEAVNPDVPPLVVVSRFAVIEGELLDVQAYDSSIHIGKWKQIERRPSVGPYRNRAGERAASAEVRTRTAEEFIHKFVVRHGHLSSSFDNKSNLESPKLTDVGREIGRKTTRPFSSDRVLYGEPALHYKSDGAHGMR